VQSIPDLVEGYDIKLVHPTPPLLQFATSKPHRLTLLALVNIRQDKGETLRVFMERFGKLALQIRNLNPEVTLHHTVTALGFGSFADNLCMEPASSLYELRRRATKFMQLEELKEARNHARAEHIPEKARPRDNKLPPLSYSKQRDDRPSKYAQYTPLNANRGRILEEALHTTLIHTPKKAPTPKDADTTKHCHFHQNYGHATDECVALKDRIEELIQAGYLRRFVQGQGRAPRRRERTPENGLPRGDREKA